METDIQEPTQEPTQTTAPETEAPLNDDLAQIDEMIRERDPEAAKEMGLSGTPEETTEDASRLQEEPTDQAPTESEEASQTTPSEENESAPSEKDTPDEKGSKFAKDRERLNRSWGDLNKRKDEFETQRKAFEAEREELRARVQRLESEQAKGPQYSPEQYRTVAERQEAKAKTLEAQGDFEGAQDARELAREAESAAKQAEAGPRETEGDLNAKRLLYFQKATAEVPELKDKEHPIAQATRATMEDVVQADPAMRTNPLLPLMAAKFAQAQDKAARVPDLESEIARLNAQVKKLQAATTPGGGRPPGNPPPQRSFEDLSTDEMGESLRALAAGRA